MAAPSNNAGQPKYDLRNVFDGLRIVLPAPAATAQQVYPKRSAFDGLIIDPPAPASTSAESSSGLKHLPYDVFINHHGGDTKHTVANSIYQRLDATGLRVFLDKNELKVGDFFPGALEEAMANASLHIAIFSENYAQSPWCLVELAFMLQTDIIFVPIFYHVEPFTLRWAIEGKGIYADAFSKHEMKNRYSSEQLQRWKLALHKASLYTGEIINNQGDEEKVVTNVVYRVLRELKKDRLDVAKHPVGLDEAEQDFHNVALQSAGPIQMVGIWGMGGAGKTTLAKQLYNKKCSTIKRSSFLFDVREAAKKERLHEKQKRLLEDLDFQGKDFDNVDEGKGILQSRLRSVSVLIVLDDVDHENQLDALLPARESLGHGSLIIVTTRELRVLKAWDISAIYKIRSLNPTHAEQLFCWHAFGQPSPLLEFKELANEFIDACHGLPLSLKVLGGLLYRQSNKNYWQSQLEKLSRIVPDNIKLRLEISYDALDREEKEMFLDIACFFIGWRSSTAIAVWDGSEWNGMHGWERLVEKCLVELDEDNFIRMHDHLRDLGREIANQQSPYRLWSKRQIIEIQPQQEAVGIRGIAYAFAFGDNCYTQQGKVIINTNQGKRILAPGSLGLKIFIGNGDFIEEHRELSSELVFLQCDKFQRKNLPSWLSLKKLKILQLFCPPGLEDLWARDADAPLQLRELLIFRAVRLEKIKGLESLRSLETLSIVFCSALHTLSSLAELTFLKEFNLEYCSKLKKIKSLKGLRSLETLKIENCEELDGLPSLAELTSLKKFELIECRRLEKIEGLESLKSLETLDICRCPELNTLPSLAELTFLKEINFECCFKLKIKNLKGLRSLETFKIKNCEELDGLPSLAELTSLKRFELSNCYKLEKIEGLESLGLLETFKIENCEELDGLPSLAELISLKRFELIGCYKLEKIEGLESLRSLETFKIENCKELDGLPILAELTSLKMFELSSCHKLEKIEGLESLRSLETLNVYCCEKLNTLPSLAELTSLKRFELSACCKLEKIEGLESLRSLETLSISFCRELITLSSLAELTSLKRFELCSCDKLEKIEGLESLKSLETLGICNCPGLNTLPSLSELTSLKRFELDRCH